MKNYINKKKYSTVQPEFPRDPVAGMNSERNSLRRQIIVLKVRLKLESLRKAELKEIYNALLHSF